MSNEGRQPGKCAAVYRPPQQGSFSLYGIPEQPGIDETVSLVKGIPPLDLLIKALNDEPHERSVLLKTHIVERETT